MKVESIFVPCNELSDGIASPSHELGRLREQNADSVNRNDASQKI